MWYLKLLLLFLSFWDDSAQTTLQGHLERMDLLIVLGSIFKNGSKTCLGGTWEVNNQERDYLGTINSLKRLCSFVLVKTTLY